LLASAPCGAQELADRDAKEIGSYVLTDAGLAKYVQATKNLGPLARRMPGGCDQADDSGDARSLTDLVAQFDAIPGARAAIESAGATTREYLVITFSLLQNGMAAWALDQPGGKLPPGMSMANVNFYRTHAAVIQQLAKETKPVVECDGADDEGEAED
jgi:hypothetical protein